MTVDEGRRLRLFIEARTGTSPGWQRDLAARLGLSRQALLAWFAGRASPTLESLGALASALGCRRWELVQAMDGDG